MVFLGSFLEVLPDSSLTVLACSLTASLGSSLQDLFGSVLLLCLPRSTTTENPLVLMSTSPTTPIRR